MNMSQTTEQIKISQQDKDNLQQFHNLFKNSPKDVTNEMRKLAIEKLPIFWEIKKDPNSDFKTKNESFEYIVMCHEMLGKPIKEEWRPKEKSSSGNRQWTASKEQRKQNCDDFRNYLQSIEVWKLLMPNEQADVMCKIWGSVKT